jgi:hypothetical protein
MKTTHEKISQILNKLKNSRRPYVITGSRASVLYHRWLSPVPKIVELRIYPEDHGYWVNLLQSEAVYVSETPPTTEMMNSFDVAVLLKKDLNDAICLNKRTVDDLCYESPEDLCVHFLESLVAEIAAMEFLAVLLVQRLTFRWDYFGDRVTARGFAREAGILLEVINEHTQQSLMPKTAIDFLFNKAMKVGVTNHGYYPFTWRVRLALKRINKNEIGVTYPQTSRKWGVKVVLPRYIMDKLVLDLDYVWRNQGSTKTSELTDKNAIINMAA